MSFARFFWMMGGAGGVTLAAVVGVGACSSSSSGSTPDSGSGETGSSSGSSSGAGSSSGSSSGAGSSSGSSSGSGSGGDAGSCESVPGLYTTPGVYCPFDKDDAGDTVTCAAGQHCCESPQGSSTASSCAAAGTACASGDIDWECLQPADCTNFEGGGPVCCVVGATQMTVSGCDGGTWMEYSGFTGTKCMASCPSGSFTVCEQDSDCASGDAGAHCDHSKSNGSDFGYCGP